MTARTNGSVKRLGQQSELWFEEGEENVTNENFERLCARADELARLTKNPEYRIASFQVALEHLIASARSGPDAGTRREVRDDSSGRSADSEVAGVTQRRILDL